MKKKICESIRVLCINSRNVIECDQSYLDNELTIKHGQRKNVLKGKKRTQVSRPQTNTKNCFFFHDFFQF